MLNRLFLIFFIIFNVIFGNDYKIEKGFLDLSNNNLEKEVIKLNGEWEFYWKQFIYDIPNESSKTFQNIPNIWNKYTINNKKIEKNGFATYRLRIKVNNINEVYGLKIGEILTSYEIWINNKLISKAGKISEIKEKFIPAIKPQVVYFKTDNKIIDIKILVSNFNYRDSGIKTPILFGIAKNIAKEREKSLVLNYFLFGAVLIMGFYNISLCFLNLIEKSAIYFGIFCILMAIRILVTNDSYILEIFPNINWEIHLKIIVIGYAASFPIFLSFIHDTFKNYFSKKIIKISAILSLCFAVIVAFTSASFYAYLEKYFQFYILFIVIYFFIEILKAYKDKQKGSLEILIGVIILIISIFNDILYAQNIIKVTVIQSSLPFALFIFILLYSYVLTKHFSKAIINAQIDELTKLYNRRYFIEASLIEIERARRNNRYYSIIILDIDHFKLINDTFGHQGGDIVLQNFAEILNESIRKSDILGRIGGEEFAIFLPETNQEEAFKIAERIRVKVENTKINLNNKKVSITASLGVYTSNVLELDELIKFADENLYKAKNSGRNKTVCKI
jgi:diguanylate cyclase (GGDEF)-like protein